MNELSFPENVSDIIWTSNQIPDVQFCLVNGEESCLGYARFPVSIFKNPGCGILEGISQLRYVHEAGQGLVVGFTVEGTLDNYQGLIDQTEQYTRQTIKAAELEEIYTAARTEEEKQSILKRVVKH